MNREDTQKEVEIPVALVERAHSHAAGAIRTLEHQLAAATSDSKKQKLIARINRWNKVLEDTTVLLANRIIKDAQEKDRSKEDGHEKAPV